jgi:hypothetical protein
MSCKFLIYNVFLLFVNFAVIHDVASRNVNISLL